MAKPVIEYSEFAGGLNVDSAPHLLRDNELQIAENVDLSSKAIRKRLGSVPLNAEAYPGRVYRVIEWPRNDGTTDLLAVMDYQREQEDCLLGLQSASPYMKQYRLRDGLFQDEFNLPLGEVQNVALSADGNWLAQLVSTAWLRGVNIYARSASGAWESVSFVPLLLSAEYTFAWHPEGLYLAVGTNEGTASYLRIAKRVGTSFSLLGSIPQPPSSVGQAAWSPDGAILSVRHGTVPYLANYTHNGDVFTLAPAVSPAPSSSPHNIQWAPDSLLLAVAAGANALVYQLAGAQLTQVASFTPPASPRDFAWSPSGDHLAIVSVSATPYLCFYARSGVAFTGPITPDTAPSGAAYVVAYSPDGSTVSVAISSTSPYVEHYRRDGSVYTKIVNLGTSFSGYVGYLAYYRTPARTTIALCEIDKSTGAPTYLCELNKAEIGWIWWQGNLYFADGEKYRVYDGDSVKLAYIPEPLSSPSVILMENTSGLTGTYKYLVTRVTADGESPASPPSAAAYAADKGFMVSMPKFVDPDLPNPVTKYVVYRTKNGQSTFYKLRDVTDITEDLTPDATLDASLTEPWVSPSKDLTGVRKCNKLLFHPYSQRAFAAGNPDDKAALYYSKEGDPTEFRSSTWKRYPPSGFGAIQALSLFGDAVVVHWKQGHMRWKGVDPATDVTWWQMPISVGVVSPLALCLVPNALMFLGQGGPYVASTAALESGYVLQSGESLLKNLAEGKWVSLFTKAADLSQSCAVYDHLRERLMIAYKSGAGSPGNDRILVLEWDTQAAAIWKGIQVNHFCLMADGTLLAAADGRILKLNQEGVFTDSAGDLAVPVEMRVQTKAFDFGYGKLRKKVFSLFLTAEPVQGGMLEAAVLGGREDIALPSLAVGKGGTYEMRSSTKGERFSVLIENGRPQDARINGIGFEFKALRAKGKEVGE